MSLHWAGLIHEKLAVVATFAYSQAPLEKLRSEFQGYWGFLEKVIFEIPRRTATQAIIDFGLYFRALDDEQRVTDIWNQSKNPPSVGILCMKDGGDEPLLPREMSNKIIHAERIEWDLSGDPKIICMGRDKEKWSRAEIELKLLLGLGGRLGS